MKGAFTCKDIGSKGVPIGLQVSDGNLPSVEALSQRGIYSLTDQIRRSSRSVAANIAEGFRKRRYPNMLVSKLTDSDGEATGTQVWLDFALDCGYMSQDNRDRLTAGYEEVGKMLSGMMAHPEKFAPGRPQQ